MYTIKLLFGDSQGGAPGFQGGPLPPLNATLLTIYKRTVSLRSLHCALENGADLHVN